MFEEIAHIKGMTEEQRIEARELARDNLLRKLGGEPQFEDFLRQVPSRFGPGAERIAVVSLVLVLIAAFVISAVHIYTVGHKTYLETGQYNVVGIAIGVFFVLLAESAILALSVAPTVWETPRSVTWMFYAGIGGAAFIATIGNIDATIVYSAGAFDWLSAWWLSLLKDPAKWALATLPPFLTVLVGQILKYRALSQSAVRNEARQELARAMQQWRRTVNTIEDHQEWMSTWANTLWDMWRKGKRRDVLAAIDLDTRRLIVAREMQADQWWNSDGIPLGIPGNTRNASKASTRSGGGLVESIEGDGSQVDKVLEVFRMYPDIADKAVTPVSEATELLGVGNSTYYKAQKLFTTNGHGHADSEWSEQ